MFIVSSSANNGQCNPSNRLIPAPILRFRQIIIQKKISFFMASLLSGEGEYMKTFPGNKLPTNDFEAPTCEPANFCSNIEASPEKIDSFRKNGYVVFDNFLDEEQLQYWRNAVTHAVSKRDNTHRFPSKGQEDTTNVDFAYYLNVFIQRVNLFQHDEHMNKIFHNTKRTLGKVAADLQGVDGMRLWHEQALIKQPFANATAWHVDVPYWSFDSPHAISAWIALDDATLENGCLYFMPGSHEIVLEKYKNRVAANSPVTSYNEVSGDMSTRSYFDEIKIGKNMSDLINIHPEMASFPTVAAPLKAGSISFHHGSLGHGAGCNMTPNWRRAMTFQFMPDGSTFNGRQNILTQEQYEKLAIGDVLDDETVNPMMYRRGME